MVPHAQAPEPAPGARRTSPPLEHPPAWQPWRAAWARAAYGPDGFWTRERPAGHFATGVGTGPLVARAVAGLAPEGAGAVVDVGAGDGALLHHLHSHLHGARSGVALVGVDRRPRPAGLPDAVRWYEDHWDADAGRWERGGPEAWLGGTGVGPGTPLLVAHEWLDDLPATVAVRGDAGWHEVEVDHTGSERAGTPVSAEDRDWLERWWPVPAGDDAVGARAEVGRSRDRAWADLVVAAADRGGRALAVDYGHLRADRPACGSLVAYRGGRQRRPVPDGSANLTAGVAVDALAAAGEATGARTLARRRQADVLGKASGGRPGPGEDDALSALVRRSEHAALASPARWGGLWWLLQGRC